jgi:methyl-accepting chemotaxis protein
LLLIAVVASLGAVLLTLGLSRRILTPVEALTAAVRRMEAGDLSQRVEVTSRDEIGELARAFNSMADGLARLEELRRNMVTDVAHELRTPLSNIRGYLEAIQGGTDHHPRWRGTDGLGDIGRAATDTIIYLWKSRNRFRLQTCLAPTCATSPVEAEYGSNTKRGDWRAPLCQVT